MRITSKQTQLVRGKSQDGEPKVMYLSGADHIVRPRHIPLLLFFRASADGSPVMPTEVLVSSLEKLLDHYPPLGGRLRNRTTGSKYEVLCNNAGAEFYEVHVDGSLADFGDFQPNRQFTDILDPVPNAIDDVLQHPVLYTQVTRFTCGAVALVASSIHTITDGLSVNQYLVAWSELARRVELSVTPFNDRTLLKPTKAPDPGFAPKELRAIQGRASVAPQMSMNDWPMEHMFVFSPQQLRNIKARTLQGSTQGPYSSFYSINAHIWKAVTKARNLPPNTTTKFLTTVDARTRLKPNLPVGYFGNAICFVSATSTAGEVATKPLSFSARLAQEAVAAFTEEHMRNVLALVESRDGAFAMNVNVGDQAGHDVAIASWVKMQFLDLDFGSGKALLAAPGNNPYDGSIILAPSHKGAGYINAYISLKAEVMERLMADPEFPADSYAGEFFGFSGSLDSPKVQ